MGVSGKLEVAAAAAIVVAVVAISLAREERPITADSIRTLAETTAPSAARTTRPDRRALARPGTLQAEALDAYAESVGEVCSRATTALSQWERDHANLRGAAAFHFQTLDDAAAWSAEVIRLSEIAVEELRSLPSPGIVSTRMGLEIFPALESTLEPLREVELAAASGNFDAVEEWMRSRVTWTHGKDAVVSNVGWPTLGLALQGCPIALGV